MKIDMKIAFISMEMLIPELKEPFRGANFRGGLGILAGDIMEGLAKINIEAVGIVPFYFKLENRENLKMANKNTSSEFPELVAELNPQIKEKKYQVKVWKIHRANSTVFGLECPEVFDVLYTLDRQKRYEQEILIGKIVPLLLKKVGFKPDIIWLQEGHTVVTIPIVKDDPYFAETKFLFTTHTSVPEGMEKYPKDWFERIGIDKEKYYSFFLREEMIDFTQAAIILADMVNAVSQEHAMIVKKMFPEFSQKIIGIRNGSSRELWLSDNLKKLGETPTDLQLWQAHLEDKKTLIEVIKQKSGVQFDLQKPIIGWVRRIVAYKNQYPILKPIIRAICAEREEIVETDFGRVKGLGMQVFSAGRASEDDFNCLNWIKEFNQWIKEPNLKGKFVFLNDYNFELLKNSASGVDVWLSTPWPEWEACGTSDQRAAINGNINLTTKTGGAREYIVEGENGFFIEPYESKIVYEKLKVISELYYSGLKNEDQRWLNLRRKAFESGKNLNVTQMLENYKKLLFEPMLYKK